MGLLTEHSVLTPSDVDAVAQIECDRQKTEESRDNKDWGGVNYLDATLINLAPFKSSRVHLESNHTITTLGK